MLSICKITRKPRAMAVGKRLGEGGAARVPRDYRELAIEVFVPGVGAVAEADNSTAARSTFIALI